MAEELVPQILQQSEDEECTPSPPFKFLAVIQEADKPNINRRVYTRKVLEQQVERLQESVRNRSLMGELGVPTNAIIHIDKVSHLVTDLFMSDDKLMAEIEVLNTPHGEQLRSLLSAGIPIGFRMSGVGSGEVHPQTGIFTADESYKLVQIFACSNPA